MKPKTRDNVIYLVVGLTVAGIVVANDFCAERHGWAISHVSKFSVRAATAPILVAYFVAQEVRRARATIPETVVCTVVAGLFQVAICFGFRQQIDALSSIPYVFLVTLETFVIVTLMTWALRTHRSSQ